MADTIIETRLVAKHFGGLHAVDGVDLQVAEGAMHSIIGPNGAGKTTLFNLISGYLKPTSGQVFLRGREITGLPLHRMAHLGIGRSFQITNVFPNLTVLENVRLSAQALGRDNLKLWTLGRAVPPLSRSRRWQRCGEVGLEEKAGTPASRAAARRQAQARAGHHPGRRSAGAAARRAHRGHGLGTGAGPGGNDRPHPCRRATRRSSWSSTT